MRGLALLLASTLTLVLACTAAASGPWLGIATGGAGVADAADSVSYVTRVHGGTTTVTARRGDGADRSLSLAGSWGVPYVTMNGTVDGLSKNGRVLVLAQPYAGNGVLQKTSSFAVLGTEPLGLTRTIKLKGDFGFDTLSPNGQMLYLIQHVSEKQLLSYRVRAFDLRAGKLLPRVVADKRQRGWVMSGMPVARATSADGRWVYTLYSSGGNYPFVHALDTKAATAVCVGLPWAWTGPASDETMRADLSLKGGKLVIAGDHGAGTTFALNTRTFRVTKL